MNLRTQRRFSSFSESESPNFEAKNQLQRKPAVCDYIDQSRLQIGVIGYMFQYVWSAIMFIAAIYLQRVYVLGQSDLDETDRYALSALGFKGNL